MNKLLRERKSLDARLNRASQNAKRLQCSEVVDDVDIQTAMDNIREIWTSFLLVHNRIVDSCNDEQMEEILSHLSTFENGCIDVKTTLLKLQKALNSTSMHQDSSAQDGDNAIQRLAEQQAEFIRLISTNLSTPACVSRNADIGDSSPSTDVKLPRMILPIFDGNILEWPSFFDLFESAVHRNTTLSNSQKLYFLKSNLAGEAASLISHLRVEDTNYIPALNKLKARYNKPLEIATEHIQRFLNQPSMTSPSATNLRSLHDISDEVIRALAVMNHVGRDIWLVHILVEKLDPETKQLWFQKKSQFSDEVVTLEKFLEFIDLQSCALKSAQPIQSKQPTTTLFVSSPTVPSRLSSHAARNNQRSSPSCSYCHRSFHHLYQCGKFRNSSADERLLFIRSQKMCENCLRCHPGKPCQSGNCRICRCPHHTLVHDALQSPISPTPFNNVLVSNSPSQALISLDRTSDFGDTNVLLLTATVKVYDNFGRPHTCRAILDSASHTSYITANLCAKLGLTTTEVDFVFEGIAGSTGHANRGALITFASRCLDYQNTVPCVILDRLSSEVPSNLVDCSNWPIPKSIHLADPEFYRPGEISLLLGTKLFAQLLEPGTIRMASDDSLPILQNTKLGWVISGGYKHSNNQFNVQRSSCLLATVGRFSSSTKSTKYGFHKKQRQAAVRCQYKPFFNEAGAIKVGGRKMESAPLDAVSLVRSNSSKIPEGNLVGGYVRATSMDAPFQADCMCNHRNEVT